MNKKELITKLKGMLNEFKEDRHNNIERLEKCLKNVEFEYDTIRESAKWADKADDKYLVLRDVIILVEELDEPEEYKNYSHGLFKNHVEYLEKVLERDLTREEKSEVWDASKKMEKMLIERGINY